MGWLFYTDPNRVIGHAGEKDEITRMTTFSNDEESYRPLQVSKVGSTWYAAVEKRPRNGTPIAQRVYVPNEDGSFVFAAIFLVKYHEGCFGYKDMDETMGPNQARAPMSLIQKLSPLVETKENDSSSKWAKRWRSSCKAFAAIPSYKVGDVIELGRHIELESGHVLKRVKKASQFYRGKNRTYYIDEDKGGLYRLSRMHFAGSKLLISASISGSEVLNEFTERRSQSANEV